MARPLSPPSIMGILNVTPDSFSDGGLFHSAASDPGSSATLRVDEAVQHARELAEAGAAIIDIGGESTRPGAEFVSWETEWERIGGVVREVCRQASAWGTVVSVDTWKPEIIERCLDLGCQVINSVRGLSQWSESLLERICSYENVKVLAMHHHGTPRTMQQSPLGPEAALQSAASFYAATYAALEGAGFARHRIMVDPGIGFGKTDAANFQLLGQAMAMSTTYQFAVGASRKGFIGRAWDITEPTDRDGVSKVLELGLALGGIAVVRTHDVRSLRRLIGIVLGTGENVGEGVRRD